LNDLDTKFRNEFQATTALPWVTIKGGKVAGEVRAAGGGGYTAGNVTFVNIYEAGHMVPFDQPEAALVSDSFIPASLLSTDDIQDMFTRWLDNHPLTL
jgi:cathepsin A (carboxypeptidase C)